MLSTEAVPPLMLSYSSIVHVYWEVKEIKGCPVLQISPNRMCGSSSCLLAVYALFLANSSPIPSL